MIKLEKLIWPFFRLKMRTLAIANMEVGSVWMRLVRVRGGAPSVFLMKPSAVSSSSKTTRTIRHKNHLSTFFPSSNPPPITFLSPLSPTRRPLSTATCSPQIPLATIEDYCSDAGGHACVYTRLLYIYSYMCLLCIFMAVTELVFFGRRW